MLATLSANRAVIEDDINQLVYWMQGGLDYEDAWLLTADQRQRMINMLEKIFKDKSASSDL